MAEAVGASVGVALSCLLNQPVSDRNNKTDIHTEIFRYRVCIVVYKKNKYQNLWNSRCLGI